MQDMRQTGVGVGVRRLTCASFGFGVGVMAGLCGCTPISIAPVCPNSLRVGESGPVVANVQDAKVIAIFQWEAFPEGAGTFESPNAPDTRFTPAIEGEVELRLTASDGLFQVISQCVTRVSGAVGASVALGADPAAALIGEVVTLTCSSNGTFDLSVFAITQTGGADVGLTQESQSVATFVPSEIGDVTFRCVGETSAGAQTDPATITIAVNQTMPEPDPPGDGGTGLPPRGGGR